MGMLRTAGRVAVATRVHGNVQRRQQNRWAQQDAAQQAASAPAPPPPPAPVAASVPDPQPQASSTAEMLELLAQLGALRDSGVLTPEEFEVQKAHVLAKARQG